MRQPDIGVKVGYPGYIDTPDDFFVLMGFVLMSQGIGTDDLRMMTHFKEALARLKDDSFGPAPVAGDEPPRYLDNVHLFSPQGNVKVGAKSLVLVVSGTSKSEIRISKLETISNFEYQMTKTFHTFIQYLRGSSRFGFWTLVIRICFGFRASCFEFMENRISK